MAEWDERPPIIIIGAGRSGTNMLRDVLTRLPGFSTWPCDEIPFIWRHGNAGHPTDELEPEHATPKVRAFIRGQFESFAQSSGAEWVVEKTCANTLRVGFVAAVFPEARFLHIVRDGRDVAASAALRWTAPFDLSYTLKKARWVPPIDLPYYGLRFLWNRARKLASPEGRLAAWGPRFEGMPEAVRSRSTEEVCALQWVRSLERADAAFAGMDPGKVLELRYESFIERPRETLDEVVAFLGLSVSEAAAAAAAGVVRKGSVGKWRTALSEQSQRRLEPIVADTLARRGYP